MSHLIWGLFLILSLSLQFCTRGQKSRFDTSSPQSPKAQQTSPSDTIPSSPENPSPDARNNIPEPIVKIPDPQSDWQVSTGFDEIEQQIRQQIGQNPQLESFLKTWGPQVWRWEPYIKNHQWILDIQTSQKAYRLTGPISTHSKMSVLKDDQNQGYAHITCLDPQPRRCLWQLWEWHPEAQPDQAVWVLMHRHGLNIRYQDQVADNSPLKFWVDIFRQSERQEKDRLRFGIVELTQIFYGTSKMELALVTTSGIGVVWQVDLKKAQDGTIEPSQMLPIYQSSLIRSLQNEIPTLRLNTPRGIRAKLMGFDPFQGHIHWVWEDLSGSRVHLQGFYQPPRLAQ